MKKQKSIEGLSRSALASSVERRLALPVSDSRLRKALKTTASYVAEGEAQYLPIFLRLEDELASCVERQDAIERARSFCEGRSSTNQATDLMTFLITNR